MIWKLAGAVMAPKKAFAQKPADAIVMHHSDRGLQYCSTEYGSLLTKNNALISMTQNGAGHFTIQLLFSAWRYEFGYDNNNELLIINLAAVPGWTNFKYQFFAKPWASDCEKTSFIIKRVL